MSLRPFLEAIDERAPVCGGAMGTLRYAKGVFINRCFDGLNLTQPAPVGGVHAEYVKAGADVVETNTFGANRIKLASFGLGDKVQAINAEGANIAREACRGRAYVAGAIGPLGIRIGPWGRVGVDEAQEYFREQAEALAAAGADLFVIETFRDLDEIRAAVAAVRSVCALPVVAQMTTEEDGGSLGGTPPEEFAPALESTGADVIGLNCSVGPAPLLESIERMAGVTRARLSVQPNAGKPRDLEGRTISLSSPEYTANEVPGVRVPPGLAERMRVADEHGRAPDEGVAIAHELVAAVRPLVSGVQVRAAGRQISSILGVLEAVG